jgi:hypothetical protein
MISDQGFKSRVIAVQAPFYPAHIIVIQGDHRAYLYQFDNGPLEIL